jgi:hypothetical protein
MYTTVHHIHVHNCTPHSYATHVYVHMCMYKDRLLEVHSITINVEPTKALLYNRYTINAFLSDKINTACLNLYLKLKEEFKNDRVFKRHFLNFGSSVYCTGHGVSYTVFGTVHTSL